MESPENQTELQAEALEQVEDTHAQEIERLKSELTEMKDKWVRTAAELENTRKRAQRDVEEAAKYGITNFARDMVNVLENLKRASDSIPAAARAESDLIKTLAEGVELTMAELLSIFSRTGIVRIDPMEQKFDHNFHQAVAQIEDDSKEPGMVVQVVQAGYTIGDRLLRPAMVAVSKRSEASKKVDTTA